MSVHDVGGHAERLRKAVLAIRQLQLRIEELERGAETEPIAVVGLSCRFPGANGSAAFWELLRDGVDAVTEVPSSRWSTKDFYDADPEVAGKTSSRWAGLIEDVDRFDAQFFGIAPREARGIDPQHRVFLELAWEAFEDAGQTVDSLMGSRTGVFVGLTTTDYAQVSRSGGSEHFNAYHLTGCSANFVAGRVSHLLGLQGPALAVDTACSSSLVSTHLGCKSLLARECDLALVGGVNAALLADGFVLASKARMMAPDGRCKTFDRRADGFVRGEGCGVLVLKRLSDALRAGDRVYACIRGSAVNQDGPSSGLTVPNKLAQELLIGEALRVARLVPSDVDYVEAHGTGTALGDPIELRALGGVFSSGREPGRPLLIGSVKTNIGHLESAAGVAGLIKVILSLQHEALPPHLHFSEPTPLVDWTALHAKVPTALTPWMRGSRPRIAGVSSFGASGTNAHIILQESAPDEPAGAGDREPIVLPLSARSAPALSALARNYLSWLANAGDTSSLNDIGFTASLRRSHHEHRLAIAARDVSDVRSALEAILRSERPWSTFAGRALPSAGAPVFVFSGQGSQWRGMGCELLAHNDVFREAVDRCDAAIRAIGGWSVGEALEAPEGSSRLADTEVAQAAIFTVQVALSALLQSWGIVPAAVIGHSVGEIAAAHVAGAITLDEAARLVFHRGRIMQRATGFGRMASVELSPERLEAFLSAYPGAPAIAAINGPASVVISGEPVSVDAVVSDLEREGVSCRFLPVSYAFHSDQMEPFASEFAAAIDGCACVQPAVTMYSTVTGSAVEGASLDTEYWRRNVRQPVRFRDAVVAARSAGHRVFLEIGPHPVLSGAIRQSVENSADQAAIVPTLHRGRSDQMSLAAAVAGLYVAGCSIDWSKRYDGSGRVVSLPAYAWQRERFWIEPAPSTAAMHETAIGRSGATPFHGRRIRSPFLDANVFEVALRAGGGSFLDDHRIGDRTVFPAAGLLQMALTAFEQAFGSVAGLVEHFEVTQPLILPDEGVKVIQIKLTDMRDGASACEIASLGEAEEWTQHASARLSLGLPSSSTAEIDLAGVRQRCTTAVTAEQHDRELEAFGFDFGPSFRTVRSVQRRDGEALASVALPDSLGAEASQYIIHPALLDGCIQSLWHAWDHSRQGDGAYVPVAIDALEISTPVGVAAMVCATVRQAPGESKQTVTGDIRVTDTAGRTRTGDARSSARAPRRPLTEGRSVRTIHLHATLGRVVRRRWADHTSRRVADRRQRRLRGESDRHSTRRRWA